MALTKIGKEGITGISNSANANAITIDSGENVALSGTLGVTGAATLSSTAGIAGNATVGGTLGVTGAVTANAGVVVDNITIDGTEIDLSSGDLTIDVAGKIKLSADDAGTFYFQDADTIYGVFEKSSTDWVIRAGEADGDIVFKGLDASSAVTALTLDMSAAGTAIFNSQIQAPSGAVSAPTFAFSNDTNTGMSRPTSDALNFVTGGAERMRIASDGKVGIGTSVAPAQKLTVTGTSGANVGGLTNGILSLTTGTGAITDTRILFGIVDDNYGWIQPADYGVAYRNLILNPNGGNIGIGTASPSARLETVGASNSTATLIKPQGALPDNNDNAGLYVQHQGSAGTGLRVRTDNAITGSNFAHILVNNASASINAFQVSQYGTGLIAKFDKSGTAALSIDNAGRLTQPLQPSFQGGIGSLHGTGTLKCNSVYHNQGNHYNTSTGLFTAPVTGKYLVGIMVMTQSNLTLDIGMTINGSVSNMFVPYQAATGGGHQQVSGVAVAAVSANDTIGFNVNSGDVYGGSNGRHSSVTFHLLS